MLCQLNFWYFYILFTTFLIKFSFKNSKDIKYIKLYQTLLALLYTIFLGYGQTCAKKVQPMMAVVIHHSRP